MTDSPRDLQAEELYRRLWRMWPEGMTVADLLDDERGAIMCADALLGRCVERVRRERDGRAIYRARMT